MWKSGERLRESLFEYLLNRTECFLSGLKVFALSLIPNSLLILLMSKDFFFQFFFVSLTYYKQRRPGTKQELKRSEIEFQNVNI